MFKNSFVVLDQKSRHWLPKKERNDFIHAFPIFWDWMEVNEKNNLTKWLKFAFLKAKEKLLGRQFLKTAFIGHRLYFFSFLCDSQTAHLFHVWLINCAAWIFLPSFAMADSNPRQQSYANPRNTTYWASKATAPPLNLNNRLQGNHNCYTAAGIRSNLHANEHFLLWAPTYCHDAISLSLKIRQDQWPVL